MAAPTGLPAKLELRRYGAVAVAVSEAEHVAFVFGVTHQRSALWIDRPTQRSTARTR
jgi:hypothetical protein